jgi:small redox-active disulfide protein 2
MKKIQILGMGCAKCNRLEENARTAAKALGITCEIEKVDDIEKIMSFGVMSTPALAIDGVVKAAGKVLTSDEIKELLK